MTLSELIAEVQSLTGREGDTVLITSARVVRFLNEAQTAIVERCIGHVDLEVSDDDAITLVTDTYSYSFASLSPTVKHLLDVYYMDGTQSRQLEYRDTKEFDKDHPYPLEATGIPKEWTRRGSTIEIWPVPSSAEDGKYLRFIYTKIPTAFSTSTLTASCLMTDADRGLVYFAVSESHRAIGLENLSEADAYEARFYAWLEDYRKEKDGRYGTEMNHILG